MLKQIFKHVIAALVEDYEGDSLYFYLYKIVYFVMLRCYSF